MKVAHRNNGPAAPEEDILRLASSYEKNGEPDKAEKLYLRYLRRIPGSEHAFSRLMIIYRKQGETQKEIGIIDRAIKTFLAIFKKTTKVAPTRKTVEISRKLMKAMGLLEKTAVEQNEREPLRKWKKRKEVLLKSVRRKRNGKSAKKNAKGASRLDGMS